MGFYENIREISLAGFQTFDKLTHIPIRRLTLLFGPNSAGKSAVDDALEILYELYGRDKNLHAWADRYDFSGAAMSAVLVYAGLGNSTSRFERLHRHWRRTGEYLDCYAEKMHLGVMGRIETSIDSGLAYRLDREVNDGEPDGSEDALPAPGTPAEHWNGSEVRLVTEFRWHHDEDNNEIAPFCDIELHINGVPVTALVEDEKVGLNIRHWALQLYDWENDFNSVAEKYPELVTYEDGWIWFKSDNLSGRDKFPIGQIATDWGQKSPVAAPYYLATEAQQVYNELFSIVLGNWNPFGEGLHTVKASRTIPTEQDLAFFLDTWEPSEANNATSMVVSPFEAFGLKDSGAPQYKRLAESLVKQLDDERLAQNVNRMLTDHLFADRGYALRSENLFALLPNEIASIEPHKNYPMLVRLFLVDAKGRQFSFAEVGSGLGYVLPVLCAACDTDEVALIQQPELHLHPALQSELGDVFIDAAKGTKKLVVETHSEHILLRILKRIRQTHAGTIADDALRITADEVAAVYFDPCPDGTTHVKHLRISEDGDFLDRWPRGFFDERGKELFDE